jgi:hypothetical protein
MGEDDRGLFKWLSIIARANYMHLVLESDGNFLARINSAFLSSLVSRPLQKRPKFYRRELVSSGKHNVGQFLIIFTYFPNR